MKQFNYVYKITNLVNGKIYIGKHSTDDLDDGYMGSSRRVKLEYSAIGKENFEKTILAYSNDEEELAELERHYITLLNATDPTIGYNRQINSSRYSYTEERNQKISQSRKGKTLSIETKQKISQSLKGREPWNKDKKGLQQAWNKGKTFTEEHRKRLSEANKGRIPWNKGKKGMQQAWNKDKKLKPFSEETKRKMSESARLVWQRRKNKESQI